MAGRAAAAQQRSIFRRWLTVKGEGAVELYTCADRICGRLAWMKQAVNRNRADLKLVVCKGGEGSPS